MTQLIKKDTQERTQIRLGLWEERSKKSGGCSGEGAGMFGSRQRMVKFGFTDRFSLCPCPQPDRSQQSKYDESAESLGRALLGKKECCLFWTLGMLWECARQSAAGHIPKKYVATWRALLSSSRKSRSSWKENGGLWAQQSFGGRGIVCNVRFAPDGRDVL